MAPTLLESTPVPTYVLLIGAAALAYLLLKAFRAYQGQTHPHYQQPHNLTPSRPSIRPRKWLQTTPPHSLPRPTGSRNGNRDALRRERKPLPGTRPRLAPNIRGNLQIVHDRPARRLHGGTEERADRPGAQI